MNKPLWEISREIQAIEAEVINKETGEINQDYLEEFEKLEISAQEKAISIAVMIKREKSHIEEIKLEEKRLKDLRKSSENEIKKWGNYLTQNKMSFLPASAKKLVDTRAEISFIKSTQCKETVLWDEIPKEYIIEKITYSFDKTRAKKEIIAGKDLEFAENVECMNIQIK